MIFIKIFPQLLKNEVSLSSKGEERHFSHSKFKVYLVFLDICTMQSDSKNIIFLTGFMGVGKTTLGERAARKLSWQFIDLDQEIEHQLDMKVKDIISQFGEPHFRKLESDVLLQRIDQLSSSESFKTLFSLGGGTLQNEKLVNAVREVGTLIWIKSPQMELSEKEIRKRPLFFADSKTNLYKNRKVGYMQSDALIEVTQDQKMEAKVDHLIEKITEVNGK